MNHLSVALCCGLVLGCGDDDGIRDAGRGAAEDGAVEDGAVQDSAVDAEGDGGIVDEAPLVLCGFTVTPDGITGYLGVVPNTDESTRLDLGEAVASPDIGTCTVAEGSVFVSGRESPEITRYNIDPDTLEITQAGRFSMSGVGIPALAGRPGTIQVVSESKGYYLDEGSLQAVVFDPSLMEIESTFSIDAMDAGDGSRVTLSPNFQEPGRVMMVGTYARDGVSLKLLRVGFIDTETDAVTTTDTTECGCSDTIQATDGTLYLAAHSNAVASHRTGREGSFEPCMVRILPGADTFDPTYLVNPAELTGTPVTASIVNGGGSVGYVVAYDEALIPIADDAAAFEVTQAAAWRLYRVPNLDDPEAGSATLVNGVDPGTSFLSVYSIDGRPHLALPADRFSETPIFEIAETELTPRLTAPGFLQFAQRLF
ncbi:MAG: hypothetical protein AAGE52_22985 [Myxococcota bacterium]